MALSHPLRLSICVSTPFISDRAQIHFTVVTRLSRLKQLQLVIPSTADEVASLQVETMQQASASLCGLARARSDLSFDPGSTSARAPHEWRQVRCQRKKGLALEEFDNCPRPGKEYPRTDVQQFYFMGASWRGPTSLERYDPVPERMDAGDSVLLTGYLVPARVGLRAGTGLRRIAHARTWGSLTASAEWPDALTSGFTPRYCLLRQVVSSDLNTLSLSEKSAALDLGTQGVAPYYALMTAIHCLYGEHYERRATERLGKFLAEEVGLPAGRVKLVNPDTTTHDALGAVVSAMTITSMAVTQTAIQHQQQVAINNEMVRQNLGSQQIQADQIQSAGQNILEQRQNEAGERQDLNDAQRTETAGLEQQAWLAERGFDQRTGPGCARLSRNSCRHASKSTIDTEPEGEIMRTVVAWLILTSTALCAKAIGNRTNRGAGAQSADQRGQVPGGRSKGGGW